LIVSQFNYTSEGKMDKDQVRQEAISVLKDVGVGLSFWGDHLYHNEWQQLSDMVQKLKSLKDAAIRREKEKLGH
jgi:hypothetical protein